mgnify:CR=1 FL=1
MNEDLKKKQQLRVAFLNKVYELSSGDTEKFINGGEVATEIGLKNGEEDQARTAANYLEGEGLVRIERVRGGFPGHIRITHEGLREIEGALGNPDKPTEHFMPINVLNIGQMIGSNIQQGTTNSTQTITINTDALEQIKEFLDELSKSKNELHLKEDEESELSSEVATLNAQSNSPKPKEAILRESLGSIKRILEAATGSAIGAGLAAKIPLLLAMLL